MFKGIAYKTWREHSSPNQVGRQKAGCGKVLAAQREDGVQVSSSHLQVAPGGVHALN